VTYPKIELHVHLEGTVRPKTLLEIAHRNGHPLPAATQEEVEALYDFRDFAHFLQVFELAAYALQSYDDFRRVVVEYAEEAVSHGAVYLEGIFTPGLWRGLDTDEVFSGYCDGAQHAREQHGIEVRLTPDIPAVYSTDEAEEVARFAVKYRERGVVGLGLAGPDTPLEPFAKAFAIAREGGLGGVPHAGEISGPQSVRGALDVLQAERIRHGIRAAEDSGLVNELAGRRTVLDVCPISNLRTGVVRALEGHPLPQLVAAGVPCSISTDDPAMFGTDLSKEYAAAASLGVEPQRAYEAGVEGALCDEDTRTRLRELGDTFDWDAVRTAEVEVP
jgi:aminodeoxyfutalosine deaminase